MTKTTLRALFLAIAMATIAIGFIVFFRLYLKDIVSLPKLVEAKEAFAMFAQSHVVFLFIASILAYVIATALLIPSVSWLSIMISYIFGAAYGVWTGAFIASVAIFIGVMIGVPLAFILVRTIVGDHLRKSFAPSIDKFAQGVEKDALFYIIAVRLVPLIPYVVINAAPALVRVPLKTHMLATAIGIFPGIFAFSYLGASLTTVLQPTGIQITWQLFTAFSALGLLALLPVILKYLTPDFMASLLSSTAKNDEKESKKFL